MKYIHSSIEEDNYSFWFLQMSYVGIPPWLNEMCNSIYFSTCIMHQDAKKNDLDHFCIDCRRSVCSNSLSEHMHHNYVKVYFFHSLLLISASFVRNLTKECDWYVVLYSWRFGDTFTMMLLIGKTCATSSTVPGYRFVNCKPLFELEVILIVVR